MPDQLEPDQDAPDHDAPDHDAPDHEAPDHDAPDQEAPDQEAPDHEAPDHDAPDHDAPLKDPPSQAEALASLAASAWASMGLPKMSCSPDKALPLASTACSDPRDASRLPVPFEVDHVCAAAGVGAFSTAARFSSPLPLRSVGPYIEWVCPTSSALTWSGVSPGRWLSRSAAAPETTAAACDVPLPRKNRLLTIAVAPNCVSMNEPGSLSDTMCTPGAERSGLRVPSPSLVKLAGV